MGFLLKEVLRTLCGRNQWSYGVFWKIGCQNSKLLIWEECYYETLPCPFPTHIAGIGTFNFSFKDGGSSQLRNQEGEGICSLVNKMMVNSSVNIAGEGIIGRAAFTGNHEWILLNNLTRDAYPPEAHNELHHQFSAGMQTVAVIPVLPHGVVQLGSSLAKMENIGLINEVKSLILQLGCIPGALLSEDCSAKAPAEILSGPATIGEPVSVNPSVFTLKCIPSMANGSEQQNNSSHASSSFDQLSHPLMREINNHQSSLFTHQSTNLIQPSSKYNDNFYLSKATAIMKPSFGGQLENRVMEAEVLPLNLNSGLQPHSILCNARSACNELTGFGQSCLSDNSIKFMEQQILSCIDNQDHVIPATNATSALKMSRLITNGSQIADQSWTSVSTTILGGIPIHGGMNSNLRPNLVSSSVSNPPRVATADFSGTHTTEIELQYDNLTEAGVYSLPDLESQSSVTRMVLEGPDRMSLPADLKCSHDVLAPTDQRTDDDLLHALKIPSLHLEEHVLLSGHIPGIVNYCLNNASANHSSRKIDAKPDGVCARPSSGEDLFDVLGADFKNKLLNENWNTIFADELDANTENLDKKATRVGMQGIDPGCYSINETISDSGVFSGSCTDHLLDAVVSKIQSVVKQDSDDMSCKTTLTRISNTSVPSPAFRQPMSNHVLGGLFGSPKTLGKSGAAEASSLRSGCSKDDAGNCSQTTSIYGSQLSSWVESASNIKRESSVSTGYSKRSDRVAKSTNHKRLKPGGNPRPRPKDRQMIQDHVKELREIVPNGAKCSIDALLERTIKHMLFLQSVTKHADKLKQTGESKIISKEGGLLLKDNFEGGATWAYEVGSQSMVCPIIVEDLNPPRQMLVEMLCEERGFFLEIADLMRGMGLTILKGVMEARNDKIWARFAVEANRDVTRMEIFMSLVHLLEQTGKGGASSSNPIDNSTMPYHSFPQAAQIPATGMPSGLQ